MKQLFFITLLIMLSVSLSNICKAQTTIGFTYEESGNRDSRAVITLKSTSIENDNLAEENIKPLEDIIGLQKTIIYPNPTKGLLRVDFPNLMDQKVTIMVLDSNGKLIVTKETNRSDQVDLSNSPSGLYIMSIAVGNEKKDWKIIKE